MKDMTIGNPVKQIVMFAIPMLIGNIFQQVYNVVDTLIVGRYLGEEALAGVGSTGTISYFLLALVYGLCNGAGLVIAQCIGSGNKKKIQESIVALVFVAGGLSIVMMFIGLAGTEVFLRLLNVPENVLGYSVTYLRILFCFILASVIYNGAASILRSVGDSKRPLYALIISSLINACLDVLFIMKFHMGVAGAAFATVISQTVSAAICLYALFKIKDNLGMGEKISWKVQKETVMLIVKTGFPSAFQSCLISLGGMSVQRLVNSFGSATMAAYVTANKIDSVAIQVIVSIGTALSVFTGQNIGKNNYDRIREGLKKTLGLMVASSVMIAILVLVFRYSLMKFFLGDSASKDAIKIGATYLSIIGVAYVIAGVMQSYQNVIRGAGDVNTCMIAGMTELAGRIVFAYLLSLFLGKTGIWIATPLSWFCGCVVPVYRYYSGKWKTKKLV